MRAIISKTRSSFSGGAWHCQVCWLSVVVGRIPWERPLLQHLVSELQPSTHPHAHPPAQLQPCGGWLAAVCWVPNEAAQTHLFLCVPIPQECEVRAFPFISPPAGPLRHLLAWPPAGTPLFWVPPAGLLPFDSMGSARVAVSELCPPPPRAHAPGTRDNHRPGVA